MDLEQFETWAMYICGGGLILFMFFIVWDLAKKSKAGRFGTFILFGVLGFAFWLQAQDVGFRLQGQARKSTTQMHNLSERPRPNKYTMNMGSQTRSKFIRFVAQNKAYSEVIGLR